jgi:hypothetical protein
VLVLVLALLLLAMLLYLLMLFNFSGVRGVVVVGALHLLLTLMCS